MSSQQTNGPYGMNAAPAPMYPGQYSTAPPPPPPQQVVVRTSWWQSSRNRLITAIVIGGVVAAGVVTLLIVLVAGQASSNGNVPSNSKPSINKVKPPPPGPTVQLARLLDKHLPPSSTNSAKDISLAGLSNEVLAEMTQLASQVPATDLPPKYQKAVRLMQLKASAQALIAKDGQGRTLNAEEVVQLKRCQLRTAALNEPALAPLARKYHAQLQCVVPSTHKADPVTGEVPLVYRDNKDLEEEDDASTSDVSDPGSAAIVQDPEQLKQILRQAQAILAGDAPPSKEDVQFVQDNVLTLRALLSEPSNDAQNIGGSAAVMEQDLDAFLGTHQPVDFDIRDRIDAIIGQGADAPKADVQFVLDQAERALAIQAVAAPALEQFLQLHASADAVDVGRIDRILDEAYAQVSDADIAYVREHGNNGNLGEQRKRIVRHFLSLHDKHNRANFSRLHKTLGKATVGQRRRLELQEHAWNPYGLPVNRLLKRATFVDPYNGNFSRPTLQQMTTDLYNELTTFRREGGDDAFERCCNVYEQIIQEVETDHLEAQYPQYMQATTFEEWALPSLLAQFDSLLSSNASSNANNTTNGAVMMTGLFEAIQRCILRGHPRYAEFHGQSLEHVQASHPAIQTLADYQHRMHMLTEQALRLLERPPLDESLLAYVATSLVNVRRELATLMPVLGDDGTALQLPEEATAETTIQALALGARPHLLSYFEHRLLHALDAPGALGNDRLDACIDLVRWFQRLALTLAGAATCGSADYDALTPSPDGLRGFAIRRAYRAVLHASRHVQTVGDVTAIHDAWIDALAKFGKPTVADDPHGLGDVSSESDTRRKLKTLAKADLFGAITAGAEDAVVEAKLQTLKRVSAAVQLPTKRYNACHTAQQAKQAYQASNQIPQNRANRLLQRLSDLYANPALVADDEDYRTKVTPLITSLKQLVAANLDVWAGDAGLRAVWASFEGAEDVQDFCRGTPAFRDYRCQWALFHATLTAYTLELADQVRSDQLHAQLVQLRHQLQASAVPSPKPLKAFDVAPKKVVDPSTTSWETFAQVQAKLPPYTSWIGDAGIEWAATDHVTSSEFLDAFYARTWLQADSDLYAFNPIPRNKNLLFHFFSFLPFDGHFSPLPAVSTLDVVLPTMSPQLHALPDALLVALGDTDTHLQALATDPVHLMLWALRTQQALYCSRLSAAERQNLVDAYKRVKEAVRAHPFRNELIDLLWDMLNTPVTRDAWDDVRSSTPTYPAVRLLFVPVKPKDVDLSASVDDTIDLSLGDDIAGPAPGMLYYLLKKLLSALSTFRHNPNDPNATIAGINRAWMFQWELQLTAAFNPDIMLPEMRSWLHRHKQVVSGSIRLRELIRGYAVQNRSTYLYDETFMLFGEPLNSHDTRRPVPHWAVNELPIGADLPFASPSGNNVQQLNIQAPNLGHLSSEKGEDSDSCKEAQRVMQPTVLMFRDHWDWFSRRYSSVRFNRQPGADAGGLSRDLITMLWRYLMNGKHSKLLVDAIGFVPNLYSDPQVGKVLASLVTFSCIKSVMPYRWFRREVHDLIFAAEPPSDKAIFDTYVSKFGEELLHKSIDYDRVTIGLLKNTPLKIKPAVASAYPVQGVFFRHLLEPTANTLFNWSLTQDELHDFSVPEQVGTKLLHVIKDDLVMRFRLFCMHLQEHFSRASIVNRVPLLHGRNALAAPGNPHQNGAVTVDQFFGRMTPPPLRAADIAPRVQVGNVCMSNLLDWTVTSSRSNATVHLSPQHILVEATGHSVTLEQMFRSWLTTKWGKPAAEVPADLEARLADAATPSAERKELEDQKAAIVEEQGRVQRRLEALLSLVTGSCSLPMPGQSVMTLSCFGGQAAYVGMLFNAHTCSRQLDIPPIETVEQFERGIEAYIATNSTSIAYTNA